MPTTPDLSVVELVSQITRRLKRFLPFLPEAVGPSYLTTRCMERRARIQLGMVEMVGSRLVDMFVSRRESIISPNHHQVKGIRRNDDVFTTPANIVQNGDGMVRSSQHRSIITFHDTNPRATQDDGKTSPISSRRYSQGNNVGQFSPEIGSQISPDPTDGALAKEVFQGWWVYLSFAGATFLALVFGLIHM